MLKLIAKLLAPIFIIAIALELTSCKDDENSGPIQLSFSETEMTVEESGDIEVEIHLSSPASQDLEITYDISGTALEANSALGVSADYEIAGDAGEIVIPKGESSAIIEIEIFSDGTFEQDETIELRIDDVSDPNVIVTSDDEITITIENDDEEVVASFATSESAVVEDEAAVEITVQIDKIAEEAIIIHYELSGTSIDSLTAWEQGQIDETVYAYDYYIDGVSGEVEIPAGSSSAKIRVEPVSDLSLENPGTIVITLVPSEGVTVSGTADEHTLNVLQEDGKVIWLQWHTDYTTVDMDLFHWINEGENYGLINLSTDVGYDGEVGEYVFFPAAGDDAEFGLSYNYYEGEEDPMQFTAKFIDFIDGDLLLEDSITYWAQYTVANINAWDQNGAPTPPIAQTYTVNGGVYTINDIVVPAEASRSTTYRFKDGKRPKRFATRSLSKNIRPIRLK
jgi:hypothetical protein